MNLVRRRKYGCKYPGCNNWYYSNAPKGFNKHYFTFPRDPYYHQLWKNICGIDVSKNAKCLNICEDHFDRSAFVNERKERLNLGAIPLQTSSQGEDFHLFEDLPSSEDNTEVNNDLGNSCSSSQPLSSTNNSSSLFSHSENNEVTTKPKCDDSVDHDHNYSITSVIINVKRFSFLYDNRDGILPKIGSENEETLNIQTMYNIHSHVKSRLSKLHILLENETEKLKILEKLYKVGMFHLIEGNLNFVSTNFLNSQLPNPCNKSVTYEWTEQDTASALTLYKNSPRLYKYLETYFLLPPSIVLKIPFKKGINSAVLIRLKTQVEKMNPADRYCTLLFGQRYFPQGFQQEKFKQCISGSDEAGSSGRANYALIFMAAGIRKRFYKVVACYFTANPLTVDNLKFLTKQIISQLLDVGLKVEATVCDQTTINCAALTQLCLDKNSNKNFYYYFYVKDRPIVTIFNVPQLLISTRDALLKCKIQYAADRNAKFEYIKTAFDLDQHKVFHSLPKLKAEHFDFTNTNVKSSVKIAATQLSSSVASTIETFTTFASMLPSEAIYTSEFVQKVDDLFDSLNSSNPKTIEHKRFRCALSRNSPHLTFWKTLITEMKQWKLIDLNTETDVSDLFSFVTGWRTTITSVIFLWENLKSIDGFDNLSLSQLNLDPLERLFSNIQHSAAGNIFE